MEMVSQGRNARTTRKAYVELGIGVACAASIAIVTTVTRVSAQQTLSAAPTPTNTLSPAEASAADRLASPFLTPPAASELSPAQAGRTGANDKGIPAKVFRYAERLVKRYDTNGDRRLEQAEWSRIQGDPRAADSNHDGIITLDELAQYMGDYGRRRRIRLISPLVDEAKEYPSLLNPTTAAETPPTSEQDTATPSPVATEEADTAADQQTPSPNGEHKKSAKFYVPNSRLAGLPDWFRARDADGDGQLTQAEFAPGASKQDLDQFTRYDRNGDGVLTTEECLRGPAR